MLLTVAIAGYRSLRNLVVPLGRLNVVTGANGSGKSSLYRALRLLADTAQGNVVQSIAQEGGLVSTLWAGPEIIGKAVKAGEYAVEGTPRKHVVSVRLGFASDEYSYLIDLGYPPQERGSVSVFVRDPEIKQECIWFGPTLRPSAVLVERNSSVVRQRGDGGEWTVVETNLPTYDSMMLRVADPRTAPEVIALRESIRNWRFYDHFRADAEAPARGHPIGTRTPILSNDGRDLAAAIATIREIGDVDGLEHAIDDAFPRSRIEIYVSDGRFALKMHQHGLLRALDTAELSDGTLRYLLWIAALLTPRPPALMVLNEPETSLHPDLLPALARLIARASEKTQVIVVSHAQTLIAALAQNPDCRCLQLEKNFGETQLAGQSWHDTPAWRWPKR